MRFLKNRKKKFRFLYQKKNHWKYKKQNDRNCSDLQLSFKSLSSQARKSHLQKSWKTLQEPEKNVEMSHKLVKRHCSCQPSSCSCAPSQITLQISCFCPQTCACPPPPLQPPTYPITTLPPMRPIPVVPVGPTLTPVVPTESSFCCILFICGRCGSYGSSSKKVSFHYSMTEIIYYK